MHQAQKSHLDTADLAHATVMLRLDYYGVTELPLNMTQKCTISNCGFVEKFEGKNLN